jgi:N-methylhydantoinase A/oxoprolinase/acetone carboxylase beta subunit
VFAKGAQFPQAGYEIFEVGLVASARKVKPGFVPRPLEGDDACAALYESRPAYWSGEWVPTPRYRWELLRPGNIVQGPVVIEAPTTTLVLPPNRSARIDEYLSVWIGQQ